MIYEIRITPEAALIAKPESEEAQFQNLLLNIIGGLKYEHLSNEEKELLKNNGYEE